MFKKWKDKVIMAILAVTTMVTGGLYYKTKIGTQTDVISGATYVKGDKICFVGDTGTGEDQQYQVAKMMEEEGCKEIRILGDIIYEYGISSHEDPMLEEKFLAPYKNLLNKMPVFITLGNHDYYRSISSWIQIARDNDSVIFPYYYYSEKRGDVCIITLDSNVISFLNYDDTMKFFKSKHKSHEQKQEEWFIQQVEKMKKGCKLSILLDHHPYLSSGNHGDADGRLKEFYEKYIIGHFDVILSGHDHILSYEGAVKETHQFISGSGGKLTGSNREVKVWREIKPGFVFLEYRPEGDALFTFKYIQDGKVEEKSFLVFGKGLR